MAGISIAIILLSVAIIFITYKFSRANAAREHYLLALVEKHQSEMQFIEPMKISNHF